MVKNTKTKAKYFYDDFYKNKRYEKISTDEYLVDYKNYIKEETNILKSKLLGKGKILEVGVGLGRLITEIPPLVEEFVGIDKSSLLTDFTKKLAQKKAPQAKIYKCYLKNLNKYYPNKYFDYTICISNTIGNAKDEVEFLKLLAKFTKTKIFATVHKKGEIATRKQWYKELGIGIKKIDKKTETFYSESGSKSKAYELNEIKKIVKQANLKVDKYKILNKVMIFLEIKMI